MNCSECLEATYLVCGDFTVDVGIDDGSYWVWIYDKFNNVYKQEVEVIDGSFEISVEEFPEGLFTEFSKFTLNISTSEDENTQEEFTSGYESYTCLIFDFFNMPEATRGCAICIKVKKVSLTAAQIQSGNGSAIAALVSSTSTKFLKVLGGDVSFTPGVVAFTNQTFNIINQGNVVLASSAINMTFLVNQTGQFILAANVNNYPLTSSVSISVSSGDSAVGDGTAIIYIYYIEVPF